MTNLKIDSFGNLLDCESNDALIIVPKEAKIIKSFAFVDLPVKRIVFEGEEILFEDNSFVNLESLEVIDVKNIFKIESLFFLEEKLSDTPLDVCLFVGRRNFVDEILNRSTYINVFYIDDVYDPDNGYTPSWAKACPFCLTEASGSIFNNVGQKKDEKYRIDSCNQLIAAWFPELLGLYIPDTFHNVPMEIQSYSVIEGLFNNFENIRCLRFPRLNVFGYTCNNYPNFLKRIHLSRYCEFIPSSFFNKGNLVSLYIHKNIRELRGFYNAYNIENVEIQDVSVISYIDSFFLEGSKFMKNLEHKQLKKNNILIWKDFALRILNEEVEFLVFPNNVRIIADGFARGIGLISITLGDKIERICDSAFEDQTKLARIEFNEKLEYIGNRAFYSNFLAEIELPDSVKYIGKEAFKVRYYEDEPCFERKILSYSKDAKLGEKCFDIEEVSLPFN